MCCEPFEAGFRVRHFPAICERDFQALSSDRVGSAASDLISTPGPLHASHTRPVTSVSFLPSSKAGNGCSP